MVRGTSRKRAFDRSYRWEKLTIEMISHEAKHTGLNHSPGRRQTSFASHGMSGIEVVIFRTRKVCEVANRDGQVHLDVIDILNAIEREFAILDECLERAANSLMSWTSKCGKCVQSGLVENVLWQVTELVDRVNDIC